MSRWLVLTVLLVGCGGNKSSDPATPDVPTPDPDIHAQAEPQPEPTPTPTPPEPATDAGTVTPMSLYEECKGRVEGPQAEGECTTDADCGKAGCSQEVCTTTAKAADLNTSCEKKPCFTVLEACGCHEGQCTWTLKDEVPAMEVAPPPVPGGSLPPSNRLPPTAPKGD